MRWSLITVTYNSAEALRRFATRPPSSDIEWVVVDNNSSDDTVTVARELGATVWPLSRNVGFARANNIGLRHSSGSLVGFVNPDLRVEFADLSILARLLESPAEGCLLAPQLVDENGNPQPNGRGVPTLARKLGNRLGRGCAGYNLYAAPGEQLHVAWAMGAAIFGERSTFDAIGAWNEAFFVYYEDHEIGLRAWARGVPVVLVGDVRWIHGWARATKGLNLRPWCLEIDGAIKFFSRYPGLLVSKRFVGREHRRLKELVGHSVTD